MIDPILVAAPLLIAAVLMAVRFVGCGLDAVAPVEPHDYSELVLSNPNLISFWRLNEPSGNTAADSKDSNPGKYSSSVTLGAPGLADRDDDNFAAVFDGSTGSVQVPFAQNVNPTTFTVEALVSPTAIDPTRRHTIVSTLADQVGYALALENSEFKATVGDGANIVTATVSPAQPGQSHYVAMSYDGANLEVYVDPNALVLVDDGSQFDKPKYTNSDLNHNHYRFQGAAAYTQQTKSPLLIGTTSHSPEPVEFFAGTIQNVAVYHPQLSFTDIVNNYWTFVSGYALARPGASVFEGSGTLSVIAAFPDHPAASTEFTNAGADTYDIPAWCTYIDVILLGGGGSGTPGSGFNGTGTGGGSGFWAAATWERGDQIPWNTTSIAIVVGSGGAAGNKAADTTATVAAAGLTLTAAGGVQGASVHGSDGESAGTPPLDAALAKAGDVQTTVGAPGNAPGGGGAGGKGVLGAGGAGAAGGAWLVARQT